MSVSIGTIIAACSLIVAFLGYQLSTKRETKSDTKDTAYLAAGMDYIRRGVDDIKIDLKANEKQVGQLARQLAAVEESTKEAHKRIDEIKKESE